MKFKAISLAAALVACGTANAADMDIQEQFDPLGPTVLTTKTAAGKTIGYVDEGKRDGKPVLFIGGSGTSAYAYALTGFLRRMSDQLGLRFITVERDGYGVTGLTKGYTYADYAGEAAEILGKLGVDKVSVVAISGGGPYAAAFLAAHPDRIVSAHFLAAYSQFDPAKPDTSGLCQAPVEKRAGFAAYYAQNPAKWWDLGKNPPTAKIPGFQTLAENDGARTFNMGGQGASGAALAAEFERFCTAKAADGANVKAPVFIYEGAADTTVKSVHGDFWASNYPNIAQRRTYDGVGHTVQYRHWDQVLLDVAGMSDKSVMCVDGQSKLVATASVKNIKDTGICAWN